MDFYATAAQVIPVLYLAMAFESKALYRQPDSYDPEHKDDPARWNASQIVLVVFVAILMTAGEVAALVGLYRNVTYRLSNALVWEGLIAGIAGVFMPVTSYQWQFYKRHRAAGGGSGLVVVLVTLGLVVISWQFARIFF
jgi:hypothetical protein